MKKAVFKDGAKQYIVSEGDEVLIDRKDLDQGQTVEFPEVTFVQEDNDSRVGQPYVAGAKVIGEVMKEQKGEKLVILKYRRRKDSMQKRGHREKFTRVLIKSIVKG
ncbi:MAG: 50S ribosomal protein L21 [Planctomycetes bacterium]|nr:50S ribosomal protein L21 [Planctomycetota bacterium]